MSLKKYREFEGFTWSKILKIILNLSLNSSKRRKKMLRDELPNCRIEGARESRMLNTTECLNKY